MLTLIAVMLLGTGVGYALRRVPCLQSLGAPISATIWVLLFLMGVGIGGNQTLLANLGGLGGDAFLLAFAATLGSVCTAALVWRFFFKPRPGGQK